MFLEENLQYLRKQNKMTQEELAEYLQVSRQSVSKWETGEAYPETEKLIAICEKFDVSLDRLVRGDVTINEDAAKSENVKNNEIMANNKDTAQTETVDGETDKKVLRETEKPQPEISKKDKVMQIIGYSLGWLITLSCVVAYLCMGFLGGLWHPGWIVFIGGVTLNIIVGAVFGNDGNNEANRHNGENNEANRGNGEPLNFKARLFGGLAGASMMASVTVYLCIGFLCNLWHPGWVIFIAGAALSGLFGGLAKYFGKND